jgi:outer membrane biosynthesis protein TonB
VAIARKKSAGLKENPLVLAAIISLTAHLTIFGGWKLGQHFGWWKNQQLPAWLQKLSQSLAKVPNPKKIPQARKEVPLIFVDVPLSYVEPPKETKFYGAANSQAASASKLDSELPEIQGKQDKVIKATENAEAKVKTLQPTPPKPDKTDPQDSKPKEKQTPGDLAVAKPQEQNKKAEGKDEKEKHVRPRKLDDVNPSLLGEKLKQQGGAKRIAIDSAFDVKVTSSGRYDREFISAVQQCWYQLLENRNTVPGKIVVEFRLHYDGRITDLKTLENTTQNQMLKQICETAIEKPAKYPKWPIEMRRELRTDSREVRFTFYYE